MKTFDADINWKDWHSFIYLVTDHKYNKYYVGKKTFFSKRTKPGNTNKTKAESNWRTYRTSNKYLQQAIKTRYEDFDFEILYLCKDETVAKYLEMKMMCQYGALESDRYYNDNMQIKLFNTITNFNERYMNYVLYKQTFNEKNRKQN